jgi:hypothetical protein
MATGQSIREFQELDESAIISKILSNGSSPNPLTLCVNMTSDQEK